MRDFSLKTIHPARAETLLVYMVKTYLKLLLVAFFWGGTFIAGRSLAGAVPPFSAAFFRFLVASAFLGAIVFNRKEKLPSLDRRQFLGVLLLGMTGVFAYNALFFNGLKLIAAGRASIIIANNPIVISLLAAFFFHESLSLPKVAGILISVSGAILAISGGHPLALFSDGLGMGDFLILGCVLSWAAYSLLGKRVMQVLSPLVATFYAAVFGMLALLIPACLEGMPSAVTGYTVLDWLNIAYLGLFGTVLGFVWYYEGIRTIGPSRASLFINFVPICAIGMAHVILDEPVTPSLSIGALMVITGVTLNHLPLAAFRFAGSRARS